MVIFDVSKQKFRQILAEVGSRKQSVVYVEGGAAVRKLRKRHAVKLANITGERNGHPYLEILPDWFEECFFPVMYSLYALTS